MSTKPRIVFNATTPEYYFAEGCHITEWWNSPDDAQASIARARVPVGVTTHWHSLRNTTERYVILEGRGIVEAGKLPPMPVSAGDVVVIPAGEPQRIRNDGQGDLVFLAICTPRFLTDNYQALE